MICSQKEDILCAQDSNSIGCSIFYRGEIPLRKAIVSNKLIDACKDYYDFGKLAIIMALIFQKE